VRVVFVSVIHLVMAMRTALLLVPVSVVVVLAERMVMAATTTKDVVAAVAARAAHAKRGGRGEDAFSGRAGGRDDDGACAARAHCLDDPRDDGHIRGVCSAAVANERSRRRVRARKRLDG
jgi:hypothetical protein